MNNTAMSSLMLYLSSNLRLFFKDIFKIEGLWNQRFEHLDLYYKIATKIVFYHEKNLS
jgi:hypothetical protein